MKKLFTVFFILLFAAGMVTAQTQAPLSVYVSMDENLARNLFADFTKETGIQVTYIREGSGVFLARMEAEKANPQASLWAGGIGVDHITGKNKGLTTPYRSRHADIIPAEFRDPENYWIGLYLGPIAFITNMDRAKELGISPPKSWAEILKPEYKGRVRMANPTTSGTAYNLVTTMLHLNNGDENKAFDYLKKLDANIDQYTRSGAGPSQSAAIGEVPVGIGYAHDLVRLKASGANVQVTVPSEGTGFELAAMSLINGGKQPVEARRLYDWIISSPVSQKHFIDFYLVMIQKGVKSHPMAIPFDQIKTVKQDMAWEGDPVNRKRLLDRWTAEIGSKR